MGRPNLLRASLAAVAGLAGLWLAQTAYSQGSRSAALVKRDAVLQAAKMLQNQYEPYLSKSGTGTCDLDRISRKLWIAVLKVPGKTNVAAAGFALPPLSVEGVSIPGAKVTVRMWVGDIKGAAHVSVAVWNETTNTEVTGKSGIVNQAGEITWTTDSFTLQPNNKYRAQARIIVYDSLSAGMMSDEVLGCVGKIRDIVWSF